ncbi:MAG: hypothetical protein R3324_22195, partial [Halobacteriales archaeon]|nr:hypothetical protein [Halobacteriales archaeon]
ASCTTDLLELLNVLTLLVGLEPEQEQLLNDVMDGELISVDDLAADGVLPVPDSATKPPRVPAWEEQATLL